MKGPLMKQNSEPVNSSMSEKEESENNVIFYGDNPVTRVLVTCDGRINQNDGRCNKCLQVAQTTSSHCGRLVEKLSEPVVSQDQEEHRLLKFLIWYDRQSLYYITNMPDEKIVRDFIKSNP